MIAVPAMFRHGPFIFSFGKYFSLQSIVLDIIYGFKQENANDCSGEIIECNYPAEYHPYDGNECDLYHREPDHLIMHREDLLIFLSYIMGGYLPGTQVT